jgi:tRNA-Thr(GGU) m(6)t(6)A37 methyltransferase TsaA
MSKMDKKWSFTPIGIIDSCFHEKFGIPRQPGLVQCAPATVKLHPPYDAPDALRGLEQFSHIWVVFMFHATARETWKATVRPPRLGGNERIGVFASRSNYRPNPIGLSVVKLVGIEGTALHIAGGDFLDQTPVLDIKPYIPYADRVPEASAAFAARAPEPTNTVVFTDDAEKALTALEGDKRPVLRQLVRDMLAFNPQPAYQAPDHDRVYGTRVYDLNVRWRQEETNVIVLSLDPLQDTGR